MSHLKDFSEELSVYSDQILEIADCEEIELRIQLFLNEQNIVMTSSSDKMHRFFQNKRAKIQEERRRSQVKNNEEFTGKKGLKDYAKRNSLFLTKI